MRKSIGAAAFVAIVFTALSASAQPNDPYDYPYCLQGKDYGLPGLCQFYKLQAMPGFGLRNIFVLWCESAICIRMATARLAALPRAMIDPVATGLESLRAWTGVIL